MIDIMRGLHGCSYRIRTTANSDWSDWMDGIVPPAVADLLETPRVVTVRLTFEQGEAEYRKTINIGDHGNA